MLHPVDANENLEFERAVMVAGACAWFKFRPIVIVYPNNDPGSGGTIRAWERAAELKGDFFVRRDIPRDLFLGLLRDAAMLVGIARAGSLKR